jgi:excisionase family DNA binding protein
MPFTHEATANRSPEPEPREPDDLEGLLRTSDVAALFQVSSRTVSEWARRGRVPCMRTPGGQWRYPAEPIRQLLNRPE